MTRPVVFDAYGTLLDVAAAARALAQSGQFPALESVWGPLATTWRDKQLAYTWLMNSMGLYKSFWDITQDALDYALEKHALPDKLRQPLLDLYFTLPAFAEAKQVVRQIQSAGHPTAILSNGAPKMLKAAADAGGFSDLLDAVISVEPSQMFKPKPQIYQLAVDQFSATRGDITFVSSNGWDIAGAAQFGFKTYWVNRAGDPVDRLPSKPDAIGTDLTDLLTYLGISDA
ncbi:MAG: haloacid dehalogenase type II [Pseudomonadota bacterium]